MPSDPEYKCWLLVSLRLSGEATAEDLQELEEITKQFPHLSQQIEVFTKIWHSGKKRVPESVEPAFERHLQKLSATLASLPADIRGSVPIPSPADRQKRHLRKVYSISALLAFVILIALLYPLTQKNKITALALNTVSTKRGSKSKIQLPDGTQVWLNADSKITYDANFADGLREVRLTGEAYFDVVKDKTHPFVIHTPTIDIRVIGTAFNVRAYADEKFTETALFRGSVEITVHNNSDRKIMLRPNEKLIVQNAPAPIRSPAGVSRPDDPPIMALLSINRKGKDSVATEVSWMKNRLSFESETLEEVTHKLDRWFDVHITIRNEKLKSGLYTADFQDENITQVMEALRITGNFTYAIDAKEVVIK